MACKIVTFNARRLNLWNSVFDRVNIKTKQKQISLHRHFKNTCQKMSFIDYNIDSYIFMAS